MTVAPTGTITFLFSDIEGSTKKWDQHPDAMQAALAKHDRMLREIFAACSGYVFKTIGDAFCVAFDTAQWALAAALECQRALRDADWREVGGLRVRMALHTGAAEHRDGDYFGQALNRTARILSAAHGGQVLVSLPTEELLRDHIPQGVSLRHLGEHRLRDLARPEQLYQLVAADLPSEFGGLRSLESVANNLPIQLSTFIGREREMAEVKRVLGTTRLLTLTGMGGTGKTRLSLQVAADVLDHYPDGVWLVEFATIDDDSLVLETVAAALNLRQEAERPLTSTLTQFLRDRHLLLILDNCEHVVAACARLSEVLLRACPRLSILASSREAMSIAGETAWPVPPMSLPDDWREISTAPGALERLGGYEAVRLFAERARMVRPAFHLNAETAPLVAQICWRLDGIPLAIELAASRIRVLTLQQIVDRLDDRFHLLTTGSRNAVPRQQTLRLLIDWSHDLLSDPERRLFRRLSVFARGRTLEAIEAICSGEGVEEFEVIDLLTQLVDKSLVYVEKHPRHGARYFILESIWDYANEKLADAGEVETFRIRHLDYFLNFAVNSAPKIRGHSQREWLETVEQEEFNIRFALEAALELPGQVSKGLKLLAATQRYVEVRGLFKETGEAFLRLLSHADAAPRDEVRAGALAAAGRLAWVADDLPACRRYQEEALSICRELDQPAGLARALTDLGFLLFDLGESPRARALVEEAATMAAPLGDRRLTAHVQHVQAVFAAADGDFRRAYDLDAQNLAMYREEGDTWQAIIMAWAVGANAAALGQFKVAHEHLRECLQVGIELGNRWGASYPLDAFAVLAVAERKYTRAARLMGAAEAQRLRSGLVPQAADHPALRAVLTAALDFHGPVVDAARQEGSSLSLEAATAYAVSEEE
ncbi:adenylate/guanylate cyclase domain-containing protein [Verrucomicrobium sp. BvORR106]|uniref:ATP-binding protein n=1 Tax=Verrucomicrobium sp. BvORR106 TaxID=1403819 RepID=UPI00056E0942|nr:adenylate/guanylate cyclase domain-containing protein [Verrucomicrobium sp. BvORR106]